jgi:hypothetical protein
MVIEREKIELTPEEVREIRAKIAKLLLQPLISEDSALLIFKEPYTIRIVKLKEDEGDGYEARLDYETYVVYVYLDKKFEIRHYYVRERDLCTP